MATTISNWFGIRSDDLCESKQATYHCTTSHFHLLKTVLELIERARILTYFCLKFDNLLTYTLTSAN